MSKESITTIQISKELRDQLRDLVKMGKSYDEVIKGLLKQARFSEKSECGVCGREKVLLARVRFRTQHTPYEWIDSPFYCQNCAKKLGVDIEELFKNFFPYLAEGELGS